MNSNADHSLGAFSGDDQNLEFRIDPSTLRTYGVVFLKTDNRFLSVNGKRKQQFEVDTKKIKFDLLQTVEENLISQNEILIECDNEEDVNLEDPLSTTNSSLYLMDHDYFKIDTSSGSARSTVSSLNSPNSMATTRGEDEDIFLQKENCVDTADYLPQCRECNKKEKTNKYCCRFYEFRKLKNINGKLTVYGFLDPHLDPNDYDIKLWESTSPDPSSPRLDMDSIKYLLSYVASQFCELIEEEKEACKQHLNEDKLVAWKRSVQGVREMCDVCETSLFNYHWTCDHCGFSVCLDCYKDRKDVNIRIWPVDKQDFEERDTYFWYKCTNKEQHDIRELMLTQIIAGDALDVLNKRLHEVCRQWGITQNCGCSLISNCIKKESEVLVDEYSGGQVNVDCLYREIVKKKKHRKRSNSSGKGLDYKDSHIKYPTVKHEWLCDGKLLRFFDPLNSDEAYQMFQDQWDLGQPIIISNCTENMKMSIWRPEYFRDKFGTRKNLLVDCTTHQEIDSQSMGKFWEGFFGVKYRLRNRKTNKPMVLKLKDWPPSDDFAEIIPDHFNDLMSSLPLPYYTARNGKFNLASHLPKHFVKPDLGPKMYSAYGHSAHFRGGSTNLHLDISDAVNVMVYVSVPKDLDSKDPDDREMCRSYDLSTIITAINDARCDTESRQRFNTERYHVGDKKKKLPGAFWHIYDANDADKIRDLLTAVSEEQGKPIETNSDPIHDQSFYLDARLRDRLIKDYSVQGYSFIQFAGDAVFIPAGAPHQVRNINDCIKVAEDFVSPENINQCFNLTAEFRELSETHLNHEDKLQIKNILYHTVKNIVSHFDIPRTAGE